MTDFMLLWLSLSLSGSLVAVALILLRPLLRRFSKTWQYYLWLLVVLRFLIPFSPNVSIVGGLFQQVETQLTVQHESLEQLPTFHFSDGTQTPDLPDVGNADSQEPPTVVGGFDFTKKYIPGVLWLSVALFLFVRKVAGYIRFVKTVRKESKIITEGQLPAVLQTVSFMVGVKKRLRICTNPLIRAPMLVGFIKPMIVLPTEENSSAELSLILRHELTHYRRMDFLYKWLAEVTVCLHWFNPFAYWVRRQINQDCEFSCDETVAACVTATERRAYGEALLNSIVISNPGGGDIASLSLNKDGKLIKERLNAIMRYHKKPRWLVLVASVLTSALLCGTVFAGAYTVVAMENVQTDSSVSPIRISGKEIAPGGKISLGSQRLVAGTECKGLFTWTGDSRLTVLCTSSDGAVKSLPTENGKTTTLQIEVDGEYTISVRNDTANTIENVNGTIEFKQSMQNPQLQNSNTQADLTASASQAVIYENVEMRRYEGADGHPYVHSIKVNETTKKITGYAYGMLAFDKDGNPLKLNWWSLDTEAESTYFYSDETASEISPGEIDDVFGGWSLNVYGTDSSVDKIAYVLYCDKEITFEDGAVWTNPDFDSWRSTYEGKKVDVNRLNSYYPYEQKIPFLN